MALDPGTYDVEFLQSAVVEGTGEFTLDGTVTSQNFRAFITSTDFGITPSGNSTTDRQNIQSFVDFCADNNITGVLDEGTWQSDNTIILKDGLRLMGRGMTRTIIDCPTADWQGSGQFRALELDVASVENVDGFYLSDLQVIGADKNRVDDGPLIRIEGVYNCVIERVMVVDSSSYGIFITGYGVGDFTNDITSDFWNSTHRVTVRDCLAIRGQIGFGTEGGAENVLFQRCVAIGNEGDENSWGLHGYRSASGYNVWYDKCRAFGYRNGFLLDRYRNIEISGCYVQSCRQGVAIGSFLGSDPEISKDLRIVNNYFSVTNEPGSSNTPVIFTDTYLSSRQVEGVVIMGNVCLGGNMSFFQIRQAVIMGNTSIDGGNIDTNSNVTGLVANNGFTLTNSASGVDDGGNNNTYTGY